MIRIPETSRSEYEWYRDKGEYKMCSVGGMRREGYEYHGWFFYKCGSSYHKVQSKYIRELKGGYNVE